jgi:hypothetical protein
MNLHTSQKELIPNFDANRFLEKLRSDQSKFALKKKNFHSLFTTVTSGVDLVTISIKCSSDEDSSLSEKTIKDEYAFLELGNACASYGKYLLEERAGRLETWNLKANLDISVYLRKLSKTDQEFRNNKEFMFHALLRQYSQEDMNKNYFSFKDINSLELNNGEIIYV